MLPLLTRAANSFTVSQLAASTARSPLSSSCIAPRHPQLATVPPVRPVTAAWSQQQAPAAIMATQDAIDLTLSDSEEDRESPTAAAAREAAQRQRIMEFARAKRQKTQDAPSAAAAAAAPAGPSSQQQQDQDTQQAPLVNQAAAAAAAGASADATGSSTAFGNEDLKALHEARMQRLRAQQQTAPGKGSSSPNRGNGGSSQQGQGGAGAPAAAPGASSRSAAPDSSAGQPGPSGGSPQQISLLTYNVWFREDVALRQRMQGIADIVAASGYPTFVALQEVTPRIMQLFAAMPWWQRYACSPAPRDAPYFTLLLVNKASAPSVSSSSFEEVHFDNSQMGRSLRVATVTVSGRKVLVATSHLESPIPPQHWFSRERQQQMEFSLAQLHKAPYGNVLFAGDMNWTDSRDGAPPLPPGWCDAWQQLHPGDPGYTYDARNNPMLPYKNTPPLRLDRVFTRLTDWRVGSANIVGQQQLGEATYRHAFKSGGSKELPVLPSDHFGLLLRLEPL